MMVVKFEIWPGGDKYKAREIGQLRIANQSKDGTRRANYQFALFDTGGKGINEKLVPIAGGRINRHIRSNPFWVLALKALRLCKLPLRD